MGLINWGRAEKEKPPILKNRRFTELRRQDSNLLTLGYEPNELPLSLRDVVVIISDLRWKGTTYF